MFGRSLEKDVISDTSGHFKKLMTAILTVSECSGTISIVWYFYIGCMFVHWGVCLYIGCMFVHWVYVCTLGCMFVHWGVCLYIGCVFVHWGVCLYIGCVFVYWVYVCIIIGCKLLLRPPTHHSQNTLAHRSNAKTDVR